MLKFTKMNGAGNDFVLLDNRDGSLRLGADQIAGLCDRHRGVGADGVLLVEPPADRANGAGADFRMRYYNADGGEAEMCGNGARCFARFASRITGREGALSFETPAGVIRAEFVGDHVRLAMSDPRGLVLDQMLSFASGEVTVHSVDTGVPHAVVFVEDLEKTDVRGLGAGLRYHPRFAPRGTNANFAKINGPGAPAMLAIRTYERGVEDETLACGTGVVAAALILHEKHGAQSPVSIQVRGGDTLLVSFEKTADGYRNVRLTGPADFVFDGQIGI
ncbi:MAG TPA: diaminopimelate epimerase [Chthoniobacteraceae bacterium]|jgi:diaminopimelate epimerase|nr:diaminopimelate epimerase [Chthoniobacteraceae bacterium]